jgi:hypothetical protein
LTSAGGPRIVAVRTDISCMTETEDQSAPEWWLDRRHYLRGWDKRARAVARFCGDGWICDIGCGMQALDRFLPLKARYLPCDLKQWTSEVEICDLNARILPVRYLALCDVITLLGVVERIHDLDWLFAALAPRAERLIVTYHCSDRKPTRMPGWVHGYNSADFSAKLAAAGYRIEQTAAFGDQTIFVARSASFGEPQRRERTSAQANSPIKPTRTTIAKRLLARLIRR